MSSRAYSTRSKAKVGFAADSGESQFQSQTQSTPNAEDTPAQELGTPFSPTQRSYRDALVSRSPSPDQGIGYTIRNDPDMFPNTLPIERDNENYLPWSDNDPSQWKTVQYGRKAKKAQEAEKVAAISAVIEAEKNLTHAERERINRRNAVLGIPPTHASRESSVSRGEGPSTAKGKGRDPRNWGNLDLDELETDIEAQRAALEQMNELLRLKKAKAAADAIYATNADNSAEPRVEEENEQESSFQPIRNKAVPIGSSKGFRTDQVRPINQVAPNSFIGQTLNNIRHLSTRHNDPSDDSSSSSSESESNGPAGQTPVNQRGASKSTRQSSVARSHRRKRKSSLKPIPPKEYDGTPDPRKFNRFVSEGTAYVHDGEVPEDRQAFVLSYYMTDTAYDYWINKVADDFRSSRLQDFFEGLFNYVFPVNYRSQQRTKLMRFHQNNKKVAQYVHELEELFSMVGSIGKREKVVKLWRGLRPSIQQGLYRDGLNEEVLQWDHVVTQAEIIELSESVFIRDHGKNH